MIRFSAALVAVAIGVLIGGIATSRLVLVYIAIVVSAVALLALALGVVLRRAELFGAAPAIGEGQGLVPAGTSPAPPAQVGGSWEQASPAAARSSAAGSPATVTAPSSPAVAEESVAGAHGYRAAAASAAAYAAPPATVGQGRGRTADPAPNWDVPAAGNRWQTSPAEVRPPWAPTPVVADTPDDRDAGREPATRPHPAGGTASGTTAAATASTPTAWDRPAADPAVPPAPASWFDRLGTPTVAQPADQGPEPATVATPAAPAATPATADEEDDDWPGRYSWLDEADDASTSDSTASDSTASDSTAEAAPADAAEEPSAEAADNALPAASAWGSDPAGAAATLAPTPARAVGDAAQAKAPEATASAHPEPATGSSPALAADDEPADDVPVDEVPADPVDEVPADEVPVDDVAPDNAPDAEPPAADPADQSAETGLVSVVPGVPRYHESECVLIKFMPEDDIQHLSIPDARAAGCTPCAACQPAD